MLLAGGIFAAYAGYLLNACYKPGMDINYLMERLNTVMGKPFANYWNGTSIKGIVGAVFVYLIAMLMYMTSQKKYMPGKEFGTAVFANPVQISKKFADKDEGKNRINIIGYRLFRPKLTMHSQKDSRMILQNG